MATLVLSTVGKLFGPLGQVVGTLAGQAIDGALFAPAGREGPRLKELAVTGSSYGQPIPGHYGTMRTAGTIVWSTDLVEHRDRQRAGKGQPRVTTYAYSVSFAVALSSRPIDRVGRIWADGNLLRGAAGDLKSAGTLRIHTGHADQGRDPLLEASLGERCPAYRGRAYAVFEDLDLTDFGNRIPALSFELFAGAGADLVPMLVEGMDIAATPDTRFPELGGFSHEGGTLRDVVRMVDQLRPVVPSVAGTDLVLRAAAGAGAPRALPPPAAWGDGAFGTASGQMRGRRGERSRALGGVRYYDPARDYQPSLQHAGATEGSAARDQLDFPAALQAADARRLASEANVRLHAARDRLAWRCAELDPQVGPGTLVTAPGHPGRWLVESWEWRAGGVELELVRHRSPLPASAGGPADPGSGWTALDRAAAATTLRVFETAPLLAGAATGRVIHAAIGAGGGRWPGAALHAVRGDTLEPLGQSALLPTSGGTLAAPLGPSPALRLENACLDVVLPGGAPPFAPVDAARIADGANRLLVGNEVLQFMEATLLGGDRWRLAGLLRGRGGSEAAAARGHPAGTGVTFLDDGLLVLPADAAGPATTLYAALGPADPEPVYAALENEGASVRPPSPVHGRAVRAADGALALSWTRRARGVWTWPDGVEQPLVEAGEAYDVGLGPAAQPLQVWRTVSPQLELAAPVVADLAARFEGASLWVRQVGTFARSEPLFLTTLPEGVSP